MKMNTLKELVSEEQMAALTDELGDNAVNALRWIKRGLNYDHPIHKIKIDMEIVKNAGW